MLDRSQNPYPKPMMVKYTKSLNTKSLKYFFQPIPPTSKVPQKSDAPIPFMKTLSIDEASTESELRGDGAVGSGDYWQPQHDYEDVSIGELASGPRRVSFTARVVNLYD